MVNDIPAELRDIICLGIIQQNAFGCTHPDGSLLILNKIPEHAACRRIGIHAHHAVKLVGILRVNPVNAMSLRCNPDTAVAQLAYLAYVRVSAAGERNRIEPSLTWFQVLHATVCSNPQCTVLVCIEASYIVAHKRQ